MAGVSPLPECGLDEAFRFAVGARGVGAGEVVADAQFGASLAKKMRAAWRQEDPSMG